MTFEQLRLTILYVSMAVSIFSVWYQVKYKITKKLATVMCVNLSVVLFIGIYSVVVKHKMSPIASIVINAICFVIWLFLYYNSDDDDNDFKRDLEKAKEKVTVTAAGLKVVPDTA